MEINDLTQAIIGCAYKVHNQLGFGFLEQVYENSLQLELSNLGIRAHQQERLFVQYAGKIVGVYRPDLLIPEKLIIEVKSVQHLAKVHELQLVNYLKATRIDNGLLVNFGTSVEVKRKFREFNPKGNLVKSCNPV